MSWWRAEDPLEIVLVSSAIDECKSEVLVARQKELQNLVDNEVFEVVDNKRQKIVSCKWVISDKVFPDELKNFKS